MNTAEQNFAALGFKLPPPPKSMGVYKPCLIVGNFLYISGHGTFKEDGSLVIGRVGETMNAEEGKQAAQLVGLAILSTIKNHLGSLDKVKRIIKVLGMVNCTTDIKNHPFIINGCSELFAKIWGNANGVGARSAIGVSSLPDNIPVEIEAIFELKD